MAVLFLTIFGSLVLAAFFAVAFAAERRADPDAAPNPDHDALLPFDDPLPEPPAPAEEPGDPPS